MTGALIKACVFSINPLHNCILLTAPSQWPMLQCFYILMVHVLCCNWENTENVAYLNNFFCLAEEVICQQAESSPAILFLNGLLQDNRLEDYIVLFCSELCISFLLLNSWL